MATRSPHFRAAQKMIMIRAMFNIHTSAAPLSTQANLRLRDPSTTTTNADATSTKPTRPFAPEHADATLIWIGLAWCITWNNESEPGTCAAIGILPSTALSTWIVTCVKSPR